MKLSEALTLRADIQKRLSQLHQRMVLSAVVQEGETPPEDPRQLREEYDRLNAQLTDLVDRINRTNVAAHLASGISITRALADRDALDRQHRVLNEVSKAASSIGERYSRAEIRRVPTVSVADLRQQQDRVALQRRELDIAIQAANWTTELVEDE